MRTLACLPLIMTVLATTALAAVEVKTVGDVRIYGIFFQNRNFTGWNATGTATEDTLQIYQRFRVRTDFTANEALKCRLGFMVNDTPWGNGTYTADAPTVSVQVYQAYLQFFWPDTNLEFTIGLQPVSLPQAPLFYDSVIMASKKETKSTAALIVTAPVIEDTLELNLGFTRRLDANGQFDTDTTQVDDELDLYFLTAPLTLPGFTLTPWGMAGVVGANAGLSSSQTSNLMSGGSFIFPRGYQNSQNLALWGGASLVVGALDPFLIQADAIYGQAGATDAGRNLRRGTFFDLGVQYTGLSFMTPGLGVWWASGEDGSLTNGSERIPIISPNFGMGNSFLFPCNQDFSNDNLGVDPSGSMGTTLALENISSVEKMTHLVNLTVMTGTSSAKGVALAVGASGGNGQYMTLGKNLVQGEWLTAIEFETKYMVYQNLALILETGWATLSGARSDVWNTSRGFTGMVNDAWKASLGLKYTF
ncbi:outer membrane homotrimeric porin [Desulfolutivibrio sulfoxidireducens]|uniref:outer membrane homotrimeric porin n=1 Tax=Desulfolutivibrio sulfoxidireducens TaxID=2773299 RepID=UPI00159D2C0C|nr:outer membrane homotrimeric porin [Desulfolutivibrio sulfoxidireducens]QLA15895.1 outer membrane homotrimeric porin [Desulfolutivibrio sulfoxidireducens]